MNLMMVTTMLTMAGLTLTVGVSTLVAVTMVAAVALFDPRGSGDGNGCGTVANTMATAIAIDPATNEETCRYNRACASCRNSYWVP